MYAYFDQLVDKADEAGIELKEAFVAAGVPDSTYYRALHGQDIKLSTARRVAKFLAYASEVANRRENHS